MTSGAKASSWRAITAVVTGVMSEVLVSAIEPTIEELGIRGRETFLAAGGTHFARLDCLNDGAAGMDMLEQLTRRELAGWWSGI